MSEPFVQLPFEDLPDTPRVPHPWFDVPTRTVDVWTEALGETTTVVRVLGEGPPLLLVHGLMTTGYSYRYVIEALAQDFTVYVPDLVGAGDATKPDRFCGPEAVADWIAALVERLGIVGCDVVGNSMGGYLMMWAVLRHPRTFGSLVQLHGPAVAAPRLWALWAAIRLPGARSILGALVRRDPRRWAHRNVHYWDESLKSLEEAGVYGDVLATPDGLVGFHRQLRDMMNAPDLRRFARVLAARRKAGCGFPIPLLLLYARRDPMVPPSTGEALKALLRDVDLVWLDEGSHFAHVDAPAAFLQAARRFWDALPPRA